MQPLASVDDVMARYPGVLPTTAVARIPVLLADASVAVRSWCIQDFTLETTTDRIRPIGSTVRLPQRPVQSVTAVSIVDTLQTGNVLNLPLGAWVWDGGEEVWIGAVQQVINLPDEVSWLLQNQVPLIEVVYSHGYATSPDPVVTVVCSMVIRSLDLPGPTAITDNTVGPVSYRTSNAAQEGILGLTDGEKRLLSRYRRAGTTVELR